MSEQSRSWLEWIQFFAARSRRPLPDLGKDRDYDDVPSSVARSLAIFQLGESGGGTVIAQASDSALPNIDCHYGKAVELFVAEEHRHANILAMSVRLLGGEIIRDNWTARLFVVARRLIGLRLKVLVLLAAEVVGLCYYHVIASQLPASKLRKQLLEIVDDERDHLAFHCDFLYSQTRSKFKRTVFVVAWRLVMLSAILAVALDHRRTIRDLGISFYQIQRRWFAYSRIAERHIVCGAQALRQSGLCHSN